MLSIFKAICSLHEDIAQNTRENIIWGLIEGISADDLFEKSNITSGPLTVYD